MKRIIHGQLLTAHRVADGSPLGLVGDGEVLHKGHYWEHIPAGDYEYNRRNPVRYDVPGTRLRVLWCGDAHTYARMAIFTPD